MKSCISLRLRKFGAYLNRWKIKYLSNNEERTIRIKYIFLLFQSYNRWMCKMRKRIIVCSLLKTYNNRNILLYQILKRLDKISYLIRNRFLYRVCIHKVQKALLKFYLHLYLKLDYLLSYLFYLYLINFQY